MALEAVQASMFKIQDIRIVVDKGGMLKLYGEPESPHEGACLRCMVNQIARWGRGVFNTCDEPNRRRGAHVSDV